MIKSIIGKAITKVIDDVGEMFLKKPGGKTQRVTDADTAKKLIGDGAKVVSQAPIRNARGLTAREREAIAGLGGQAGGVARTISRGKTSIGELVKAGQRAKPRGMGDRKAIATRPKPPAKRGQTMPIPKPKPKPPAVARPKPKPPVTARPKPKPPVRAGGTGGGGRPPGTAPRPMPGSRPGQRPPRITGVTRGSQAGAAARQAAILAQIQKNLDEAAKRGPTPAPASTPKPKKRATPGGMADRKPSRPNQRGGSGPSTRGGRRGSGRKMSDKISNIFGVDGVSKTGSTRNDYLIGWTDGKGGKGPNYNRLKKKKKKSEITAIVDTARKRATVKKKAGGKMGSETRARSRIYKAPKSPMTSAKPASRVYKPKKTPGMTGKPASRTYKVPKGTKPFSKGGKVARQVKGFGAARRPKK